MIGIVKCEGGPEVDGGCEATVGFWRGVVKTGALGGKGGGSMML